ncbi:MAG: glycosyltransferase family A protein [Thermoleophilaceae bacterium]
MELTVAICTRDRPALLGETLSALSRQTDTDFELVVVDQSRAPDPQLGALERSRPHTTVIRDSSSGLSRARNLALRAAAGRWIAFVDDDCLAADDMVESLISEIEAHPEADWVSGDVSAGDTPGSDYLPVTVFPVERPHRRSGRWTIPGRIGFGVFFAVRRSTAEQLGGWDERLGPGVPDFPAADDMDFNHRLLRAGGVAWLTPRVRMRHDQWRSSAELVPLQRGYVRAWAAFSMKHLKEGDLLGGFWLWSWGAIDVFHMTASGVRHGSSLRLRVALAKLRGLAEGTVMGARRRW